MAKVSPVLWGDKIWWERLKGCDLGIMSVHCVTTPLRSRVKSQSPSDHSYDSFQEIIPSLYTGGSSRIVKASCENVLIRLKFQNGDLMRLRGDLRFSCLQNIFSIFRTYFIAESCSFVSHSLQLNDMLVRGRAIGIAAPQNSEVLNANFARCKHPKAASAARARHRQYRI
jgi:hypothetical protein